MTTEAKTGLTYWPAGALQPDLLFNALLLLFGAVGGQALALDKDLSAPPGSPADGDTYIVAGSATGDWTGHDADIAYWDDVAGVWNFFTPLEGWTFDVADEDIPYRFSGSAWAAQKVSPTIEQNSQSAAYPLVISDAGKHILHPGSDATARTFTIPANSSVPYEIGTAILFVNQHGAGVLTIAITTDTMRLAGAGTTGNRTLAADGLATALKISATEWIISGTGLT